MRDELQKLQKQVSLFLEKGDYVKSLSQWRLLQQSLRELTGDSLLHHIQQGHQLVVNFLVNKNSEEADKLYQQLKTSCFDLPIFTTTQKIEFCQTVAQAYAHYDYWNKALEYATYGLWLSEQSDLPSQQENIRKQLNNLAVELHFQWAKSLWIEEINQLKQSQNLASDLTAFLSRLSPWVMACLSVGARKLLEEFYKLLGPALGQFQEFTGSRLHVSKQKSLIEFKNVVDQLLPIAKLLEQHQQWEHALAIYQLIMTHAEREAATFDKRIVINKITELNDYSLNLEFAVQVNIKPDWQQWRTELRECRNQFQAKKNHLAEYIKFTTKLFSSVKKIISTNT